MTDEDAARRLEELLDWIDTTREVAGRAMAPKLVPHLGEWAGQTADDPNIALSGALDNLILMADARKRHAAQL